MPDKNGHRCGMYGETPSVKIGEFTLSRMFPDGEDKTVWMEHESGEGGEFQDADLNKALQEFFDCNL